MRTRIPCWMSLLLCGGIVFVVGCDGEGRSSSKTPRATFEQLYRCLINGEYSQAHSLYSHRLQQVISVRAISKAYSDPAVRQKTDQMLRGANFRVKEVAMNHAFAEIRWADGQTQNITFIMEDGAWKIDITPVQTHALRR